MRSKEAVVQTTDCMRRLNSENLIRVREKPIGELVAVFWEDWYLQMLMPMVISNDQPRYEVIGIYSKKGVKPLIRELEDELYRYGLLCGARTAFVDKLDGWNTFFVSIETTDLGEKSNEFIR